MQILCKNCGHIFDAPNRRYKLCSECKEKRELQECPRCHKQFHKKEEYKNHRGIIDREYCKSCSDERQYEIAESLIKQAFNILNKFNNNKNIKHSLEDEMLFMLKTSRNNVRIFGYKTGFESGESHNQKVKKTDDHMNGMTSIISNAGVKIVYGELKTPEEVVDFLNQKSCTIQVSKSLNEGILKTVQNDKENYISPERYYEICEGIYDNNGKFLSLEEFLNICKPYFL